MLLKRHYKKDAEGRLGTPPVLDHIEVKHTGASPAQHFSSSLVTAGIAEGWMVLDMPAKTLTLKAQPAELIYRVLRVPGRYETAAAPSGYEVIHYYDCILNDAQHAEYRAGKARR